MTETKDPVQYDKLIQHALRIVSKKRHTESGLRNKLEAYADKNGEISKDLIEDVVIRMKELKYIDDLKFARDFISDRLNFKPKGKAMIARELMKKGIKNSDIENALKGVEIDEKEVALSVLEKKLKRWERDSRIKQKQKAFRFLYSRGFQRDTIYRAIEECYNH